MKKLAERIARCFGYELRKLPPARLVKFFETPEGDPDFDSVMPAPCIGRARDEFSEAAPVTATRPTATRLIIEGWRFLPHSYAIVNQWQLLSLTRRNDIAIKIRDAPLYSARWKHQYGLFEPAAETVLRSFESASPGEPADITLRTFFPLDFSSSPSGKTVVFGTSENHVIQRMQLADWRSHQLLQRRTPPVEVTVVTPSKWSAEGFYRYGFKQEQVVIVPHGVDIDTFHPMPECRRQARSKLSVGNDDFVFLSVGALTSNKGVDLLLRAFAEVCHKFPEARLVIKGMDKLYNSKGFLLNNLARISARDQQRVIERLIYFGKSFSYRKMAMLYQTADAYVSSYRCEGFNMPVLEAAASGVPIICTGGGATDDFVTEEFARKIESKRLSPRIDGEEGSQLEPNVEHLRALMISAIEDRAWRCAAAAAGPRHIKANYTWDRVVETLVRRLTA